MRNSTEAEPGKTTYIKKLRDYQLMIIVYVFLRIISLLQTPRPDLEGSIARIMKAWTMEHRVGVRPECCRNTCWLFLRLGQKGTSRGKNKKI